MRGAYDLYYSLLRQRAWEHTPHSELSIQAKVMLDIGADYKFGSFVWDLTQHGPMIGATIKLN